MISLRELGAKIKNEKRVALICHVRPDGDTFGSALALKLILQKLGIEAEVYCNDPVPPRFFFLEKIKSVKSELDGEFSAMIAIDCADITRLGDFAEKFNSHPNTYSIDHHISNSKYAKYNYVEDRSACCELMYDLIESLNVDIDEDIANSLLLGIVTDTGNFAHSNTTEKTLSYASKLVGKKGNLHLIIQKMFKDQSRTRATLYSTVISKMRYYLEDRVGVIVISQKDLSECNAKDNMTEGFIDFPLTVRTVEVAISFLEVADKRYKISFRSKGKVDVNEIASIYGGGGHILASGAMMNGYLEDIIDKLVYNVKQRLE